MIRDYVVVWTKQNRVPYAEMVQASSKVEAKKLAMAPGFCSPTVILRRADLNWELETIGTAIFNAIQDLLSKAKGCTSNKMIKSKYHSRWLSDSQINNIIVKLRRQVERRGYNQISSFDLARFMVTHPISYSKLGKENDRRRLLSLINVLKHHNVIKRLHHPIYNNWETCYSLVGR